MTSRPDRPGRYHPTLLALEPRMMFDAAAVVTAQDALAAAAPDRSADAGGAERSHDVHPALGDPFTVEARAGEAPLAPATAAREIVFIDTSVADYRQLAAEWADRGEVVLVDGTADGMDQVRGALAGRGDLAAIHLVGHGAQGVLWLGTTRLDATSIGGDLSASLGAVGRSLAAGGDILIYGCDFAAGDAGARALAAFADATGADVAASTDTTGYAGRGGDWVLEAERGTIEARALASGDWVHTLDPNVPVPISVAVGSLTVTDANGAVVFSSANNYNNNATRSPDVGAGAMATWANAATFQGRSVDLRATIVSLTAGDAVQFNRVTGTGSGPDDPTFLLRDLTAGDTPATAQVRWTLVDHTTGEALPANVRFTIADIDGIGGNARSRETVTASTANLAYYTRERVSDIHFTSSLDAIEASGTQDENDPVGATLTPQSAATFDWTDVSAFTLTYTLTPNARTSQAQFYHDGDADFVYTDPVYVSVPRLDLDRDDSTAPGNDAHFTFTEDGPAVPVVDADVVVTNPMGPTAIIGASVTLTNYKPGDAFTVGTLPGNLTATVGQPTNGRLTVTFDGAGSEADYAAALKAVRFHNGSDTPDPSQRVIEVAFSNDTLTSAVAVSRIDVVPVNDAPVAVDDALTTPEDTPATIAVLANDRDPDGDPLTVTAASALHGSVVRNPDGTLTYTPGRDYNGTDTITYTIDDGNGGTATARVAVTVTPVNDAPVAAAIPASYRVVDGTVVSAPAASAFSDVDGDALTYAATGLPAGLSIDPRTGIIGGTVDRSASQVNGGRYLVTLTATDPSGASATQRVTVTAVNPAPTAADDRAATAEDTPVTIRVLDNDRDPDGDPLTVTAATAGHGSVARNPDGTITYTPDRDFNGTDTIRYTISDGEGGTSQATVTVTVAPQRDAPAATLPPAQTVAEDTALIFSAANGNAVTVANVDGGDLTVTLAAGHGRLTLSRTDGLLFAAGDGSDDDAMTFTGSVAAINAALEGARFVGDPDYNGSADLRITATRAVVDSEDFRDPGAEEPVIDEASYRIMDQALVPGWSTTATDGQIEIWSSGHNGVDAYEGGQFFEINANQAASLYQEFRSVAGSAVDVTFAHRGRSGPDTMRLTATDLGADGVFGTADDVVLVTQDYTDDDGGWGVHAAGLTGAASGNLIRLDFAAVSEASGDPTIGNFLDAIVVRQAEVPLSVTETLAITVTPVADIVADRATTPEDTAVVIDALANDGFADPARSIVAIDGLAITADGPAVAVADGTVTLGSDGRLTFAPTRDYNGTTSFTYTVAAGGSTETATETVVVTPVNDAPVATGILVDRAGLDGATVSWATAGGFADVDGDALTYAATGLPAGLSIDPRTGVISGTLDRSASQPGGGRYAVTVTARDGGDLAATQGFRVTVANPAPSAADDAAVTHADVPVTVAVLANDRDPDGDPLTVTGATAGLGRVEVLADGSLRYVPPVGFTGRDTVAYTISDGEGGTATARVTIDVYDDPPSADPVGTIMVRDGQPVSLPIGAGFRDPDGDPLTFAATGLPPGLSIDPATGTISGTVDRAASRAANGTYVATVTADDGRGGVIGVTFDWVVTNPAPVAADDRATVAEDSTATLSPLANDVDPDGDPLTIVAAAAGHGRVAINPDGTLTYTPDADWSGEDTIAYTIDDGDGGRASATIRVTVTPVDDAPTTTGLPPRATDDGSVVSVRVAGAFADVDGDRLSFAADGLPAGLSIDPATGVIAGTIADGSVRGGPAGDGVYRVVVTAADPSGRSVTTGFAWTVAATAPHAADDRATTAEDTPVAIAVLANDRDPDGDPLTLVEASATGGTVAIVDGALVFTPARDFVGEAHIAYTIADPDGNRASATVTVTVTPVNDAPDAAPIPSVHGRDGQAVTLPVGAFFADRDGDALTFSATGLPAGLSIDPATGTITGTVDRAASMVAGGVWHVVVTATDPSGAGVDAGFDWTIVNPAPVARDDAATTAEDTATTIAVLANDSDPDGDPLIVTAAGARHGSVAINPDGTLAYTPDADFNGTDVIVYTISDGNGGHASASVLVTVTPVNDAPVANPDRLTTAEDTAVVIPVLANDTDVDGDPLTVTAARADHGAVTIQPDGTLRYVPDADYNGADTITYTVDDGRGGTATGTVAVTVTPVNDAPVARDGIATTAEDTPVRIAIPASDVDGDPLTITAATATRGTVAIGAGGIVTYTPAPDFNGTDTIRYTVSDGQGGTASGAIAVTVTPVNDAPVANPDRVTTAEDTAVVIPVLANDTDVDGDPLAVTAARADHGAVTIQPDGTLRYVPDTDYNGADTITYTVDDGRGGTATGTVAVTVTPVNDAPVARDGIATTAEDTPVRITIPASDVDGDPLTITAATATRGTVAIGAGGVVTYTPAPDFNGTDTIRYTVSDGQGGTASGAIAVTVTPVEDAPVATVPAGFAPMTRDGATVAIDTGAWFADADGDPLTYAAAGLPAGLTIDPATGAIRGTLDRDASQVAGGVYPVTITARDPAGAAATAAFTLTVTNPAPVARDTAARTLEDTGVTIPVLANVVDPDGDPLTVVAAAAGRGSVAINPDGTVTYVPAANFAGTDTIRYTVSDGQGGTATAVVTVTVDPVNDLPVVPARAPIDAVGGRPLRIDALAGASDPDGDRLTFVRATAANGSVVANRDGTLVFTPALGFVGTTTVAVTVSDGQGGETTQTFLVRVADGRGADIEQLLRFGRVTFLDPTPALAIVPLTDGVARNPLSLLSAVEAIRPLGTTVIGDRPVGDAVEAIRTLRGTAIDPDAPVTAEVARLDALRDQRDAGDRLFDHRWGDFMVRGLTGFSHAADRQACVMVESVVRGNAIYLEVRDIAEDGRAPIRSVDLRMAGGGRVPDWIRVDHRGLAIIERPADADELHLVVRVTRADGRTSVTPVVIQGATGEVELDRHRARGHHLNGMGAAPLDHSLNQPGGTDAARLDRFFQ